MFFVRPRWIRQIVILACLQIVLLKGWLTVSAEDDAVAAQSRVQGESAGKKAASAERVLLLHNSKVLKGVVRQTATGYLVTMPGGHLVLPFEQVRLEADDLEDAYRQQRDVLPDQSTAHIELARWCLSNGLPDYARKELREALRCDPDSSIAKNMLQRINDQLLTTKEVPAVVERNGQFSLLGAVKPGVAPEALGGLQREAASEFIAKVQPLLVNRCATAGCHGPGSGNTFELQRAKVGKAPPKSYSERNLAVVMERVDRDRPLSSPLLTKLRGETKSFGIRQSHGGLSQEQTRTLRNWIESISRKPEESAKSKPEAATDDTDETLSDVQSSRPKAERTEEGNSGDNLFQQLLREIRSPSPEPDGLNRNTSDE